MASVEETVVAIRNADGHETGKMRIALLPHHTAPSSVPPLLDLQADSSTSSVAPVQLLEGSEYRYEFKLLRLKPPLTTDRPEVFHPDTLDGLTGRIRPGLYVGTLPVRVQSSYQEVGRFEVEVRSRKLSYLQDYQWMLRDIADQMTEVVMNRFAVAEQRFTVDDTREASTLYQRFAFLRSLIGGEGFQGALREVLSRPHVAWVEVREPTYPGQGLRADSFVARQLTRAGPRAPWPGGLARTIPTRLERRRTEVTVDTVPNRFVKYALGSWRAVVARIGELLEQESGSNLVRRGRVEVHETLDSLDSLMAEELFREVGRLDHFPASSQVLQKREGYRDIYRAYIQFEVASKLSWAGGDDVYGAGQRDVATLYEYWVFLQLAALISDLCSTPFDFASLIEVNTGGLNVQLRSGRRRILRGQVSRLGRSMDIELWYNRTFSSSTKSEASWTRAMRPDYSLRISPAATESAAFHPVWLHFDAKYRLDNIYDAFGQVEELKDDLASAGEVSTAQAVRSDLLKMHAYRDAIRRSAGAYVLYPGTELELLREYHELLPGLGAFALRPTESGHASGTAALRSFVEAVLEHIASQLTQHERSRYWRSKIHSEPPSKTQSFPVVSFLDRPAADTQVLLGFVKGKSYWDWIESAQLYNLRADERRGSVGLDSHQLATDLVVLSCPALNVARLARVVGGPEIKTQDQMRELHYPKPRGSYYCLVLEFIPEQIGDLHLSSEAIEAARRTIRRAPGFPVVMNWERLMTIVTALAPDRFRRRD